MGTDKVYRMVASLFIVEAARFGYEIAWDVYCILFGGF